MGKRVRFFAAATLVNRLEEAQKQYQLDRFLNPDYSPTLKNRDRTIA
jgi:hypothetical protein